MTTSLARPRSASRVWPLPASILTIAAIYAATRLASALVLGSLSRWQVNQQNVLVWLVVGALVALALVPLARHAPWGRRSTALAILAVLALPGSIGLGIEGYLFSPTAPLSALATTSAKVLTSLLVAIATAWLLSPPAGVVGAKAVGSGAGRSLGVFGWAWRLVVGSLSYPVFYLVFGAINALAYTKTFYETNPQLHLPSIDVVLQAQLVRGPLMVLGVLAFALELRASRRQVALWLGVLLYIVAGVAPYAETTLLVMPVGFSVATLVEILCQNVLTGIVVAYLFRRGPVPVQP